VLLLRFGRSRVPAADPDRPRDRRARRSPPARAARQARGAGARVILDVRDVSRSFGGVRAVAGATFAVESGSITALIGPNGAGKPTPFNRIPGFVRADGGPLLFQVPPIDH